MNLILLFILGAIWGTSFLFIKIVVTEIGPMTLVAGRLGLAALLMWSIMRLRKVPPPRGRRIWTTYAVLGLINSALPFSLISWGEQYIPSSWAAMLQSTLPIFTILLAHLLTQDERLTWSKAMGIALGFCGVGLLMWPEVRQGVSTSVWGILAIVGASVCYALASILVRRQLKGQNPIASAAGTFTMGFAYILPLAFLMEQPLQIAPSWRAWGSWVGLTVMGTVIASVIYYTLLNRTSATFTAMVTYIVPINGLILGALVLGEHLSPMLVISLGLVMSGVLLVRR
ncbi:MAG: EamA family transporter [Anaerolineae bacterium]|nr:EamA family transporter [Anaerolineae bacterium]